MRGVLLAVVMALVISGDSSRYIPQLLRNATLVFSQQPANDEKGYAILWAAATQGSDEAQSRLISHASDDDAQYWLTQLVTLDNAEAAWALYQQRGNNPNATGLIRAAAIGHVPEAQLALAMSTNDKAERETWLLRAANQGHKPAQAALADWYLLQGKQQLAKPWLAKTATHDRQSAFKYGRLLWDENQRVDAKKFIKLAADAGHEQARRVYNVISFYAPVQPDNVPSYTWTSDTQCQQRIQMFASSLATITRADALYNEFKNDQRLRDLPLCIAPPIWLQSDALTCNKSKNGRGRDACDVTVLANAVSTRKLTHGIVIAEQGKANVQNGIMFLDISDAYSVLVHELAHFSGFIDEYPLNKSLANRYCSKPAIRTFAPPNVVLADGESYSPSATLTRWPKALQGQALTLTPTKTCDLVDVEAYKPSEVITFMEHHDTGTIPAVYLALWKEQLDNPNSHRPISMNLFQAFHKKGNTQQAGYWLAEYESR